MLNRIIIICFILLTGCSVNVKGIPEQITINHIVQLPDGSAIIADPAKIEECEKTTTSIDEFLECILSNETVP